MTAQGYSVAVSANGAERYSCNKCSTYGTVTPLVRDRAPGCVDTFWKCPKCKQVFGELSTQPPYSTMAAIADMPQPTNSLAAKLTALAWEVGQLNDRSRELDEIRDTLLVNFKDGNRFGVSLVDVGQKTVMMLVSVLEQLVKKGAKP